MADDLSGIVETPEAERLATGFVNTEGPLWDPRGGFFYFVDNRRSLLFRLKPGQQPELAREDTGEGNGLTFDMEGRLVVCEAARRRVTRFHESGDIEIVADRFDGKRINRPNDVTCRSDGSIFFTDPVGGRVAPADREIPFSGVYCVSPAGEVRLVAECESPNGLAFSVDERILYVANSRQVAYIHALEVDAAGTLVRRRIFADMSSDDTSKAPDGVRVDVEGRVYCASAGGIWVFGPNGARLGIIPTPEAPANLTFGGDDLKTLFVTARSSVYAFRTATAGIAHPHFRTKTA
jgi:gluconolactonase